MVRDTFLFSCFTGLLHRHLCTPGPRSISSRTANSCGSAPPAAKQDLRSTCGIFAIPYTILLKYKPASAECADIPTCRATGGAISASTLLSPAGIPRADHVPCGPAHVCHDNYAFAGVSRSKQSVNYWDIKTYGLTQIYATITHSKLDGDMERLSVTPRYAVPRYRPGKSGSAFERTDSHIRIPFRLGKIPKSTKNAPKWRLQIVIATGLIREKS